MRARIARWGAITHFSLLVVGMLLLAAPAWAQEAAHQTAASNPQAGLMTLALAIGSGLATLGGTYGQSRAATAALEGIARNPNASEKLFVPLLLSLALIESLTLVTWVLMLRLSDKI